MSASRSTTDEMSGVTVLFECFHCPSDLRPLGSVLFWAVPFGILRRYPFCLRSCLLRRSWSRRRCHWCLPTADQLEPKFRGDQRGPFPIKVADHRFFSYLTCCLSPIASAPSFGFLPVSRWVALGLCGFHSRLFQPAESIMPPLRARSQAKRRNPHVVNN